MTDYIYYRTVSGPAHEWCLAFRYRRSAAGERLLRWAQQHGATSFVPGFGSSVAGGWAINSLTFEDKPTAPGWRLDRRRTQEGYQQWRPNQRTEAGRALAKEMKELEGLPSDDEFCAAFNFPRAISYSGGDCINGSELTASCSITTARIGWIGDEFWIVLPDVNAAIAEHLERGRSVSTPGWVAPEGMEPLTKAHYEVARAQDRLRAQEAGR